MQIKWRPRRFEIAVVAGILMGLCVVLFMQLRNVRRGETCQSNLKQIGLALGWYARDWDEHFPLKDNWEEAIYVWLKTDKVFHCSSTPQRGYAMNGSLSGFNINQITDIAATPLFFETHLLQPNANGGFEAVLREPRHSQGIGVTFVDQQVRWQQQPPVFRSFASAPQFGR